MEPDPVYATTIKWERSHWGKVPEMADGISIFLRIWNQAFYRAGMFDIERLDDWLTERIPQLNTLHERKISSLTTSDSEIILRLFQTLHPVLAISYGKKKGDKSPVSVAKALHLLLPDFLPLWDTYIADAYECDHGNDQKPAEGYLDFCFQMKELSDTAIKWKGVRQRVGPNRSLLKVVDEYNYGRWTWPAKQ